MIRQFTIIPLFLAVKLLVNDDPGTNYVPDIVFQFQASLTGETDEKSDALHMGSNLSSKLHCQYDNEVTLKCYLEDSRILNYESIFPSNDNSSRDDSGEEFELGREPFEIIFGLDKIQYVAIRQDFSAWRLNIIKSIVNLLTIGSSGYRWSHGIFHDTENSTLGECSTHFKAYRGPCEPEDTERAGANIQMVPIPELHMAPGEKIIIEKSRNARNCSRKTEYFFGADDDEDTSSRSTNSLHSSIKSSTGRISISIDTFESETKNLGVISNPQRNKTFYLTEQLKLTFETVEYALPIPPVPKRSITEIFANAPLKLSDKNFTYADIKEHGGRR